MTFDSLTDQRFELKFVPTQPGRVTCKAENAEGTKSVDTEVIIVDLSEPMQIWGIDENVTIATEDSVTLTCAAYVYTYSDQLNWYRNGILVEESSAIPTGWQIRKYVTDYSYRLDLTWESIGIADTATYECRAGLITNDTSYTAKDLLLTVKGECIILILSDNNKWMFPLYWVILLYVQSLSRPQSYQQHWMFRRIVRRRASHCWWSAYSMVCQNQKLTGTKTAAS